VQTRDQRLDAPALFLEGRTSGEVKMDGEKAEHDPHIEEPEGFSFYNVSSRLFW
jgi:hypothetical protein